MALPKFKDLFSDVLNALSDGQIRHRMDLAEIVISQLGLSESERTEMISSGSSKVGSRIHWACEYLAQAGAIHRPQRGFLQITQLGKQLIIDNPSGVTLDALRQTEGLKAWRERSAVSKENRKNAGVDIDDTTGFDFENDDSPLEAIDSAIQVMNSALAGELLQRIRQEKPEFLERLVLRLLHAMGYGATIENLQHIGGSGDEGVDGVIHQDQLGIDKIYVQAKRYRESGPIGRPTIQGFVGALSGKKATKGVFITTSRFSADALDYANNLTGFSVVLIDGEQLVKFMLENKVGVTAKQIFEIIDIDENFFGEELI